MLGKKLPKTQKNEARSNLNVLTGGIIYQLLNINKNIAGRLPENSRNSFADLQSQKKQQTKKFVFSLKADLLYFD